MIKTKNFFAIIYFVLGSRVGFSHEDAFHAEKPTHNRSEVKDESEEISLESLSIVNKGYQSVIPIFRKACFDCHSKETKYPWYSKLPFVSHLIKHDTENAKMHLIMNDTFPFSGHGTPFGDIEAIEKSIKKGDMPPLRYQIIHWGAFLTETEKTKIFEWVTTAKKQLKIGG